MNIVSLLPSATEIVCVLGLRDRLVGVTHECDFPGDVAGLPKVTRTLIPHNAPSGEIDRLVRERLATQKALYSLDVPTLEALKPDLIVTQALCDVCAVADDEVRAAAAELPSRPRVVNLEPSSLGDVFAAARAVGEAAGVPLRQIDDTLASLQGRVDAVAARTAGVTRRPSVAVLEWLDPPFSCGHWTPELVRLAGGEEVIGRDGEPSRSLTWDQVSAASPEFILVACCGYDVGRTLKDVSAIPATYRGSVNVVDGSQYFSRPGPRLVDSLEILANTLHPNIHPLPSGLPEAVSASR